MRMPDGTEVKISKWHKTAAMIIAGLLLLLFFADNLVEINSAGNRQVKQSIFGTLTCQLDPGPYWQGFGNIHTYPEAVEYSFTADKETGEARDQSLPTRFNDGPKAQVSGSVQVLLPSICEELIELHRKYKGPDSVVKSLILPALRKAVFNSGSSMTAADSYSAGRGKYTSVIEDQLINGVIATMESPVTMSLIVDEADKGVEDVHQERKSIEVAQTVRYKMVTCDSIDDCLRIVTDKDGNTTTEDIVDCRCIGGFYRDKSAFRLYKLAVANFVVDAIEYDESTKLKIKKQQDAKMNIVTEEAEAKLAAAKAIRAEADAKTAVAQTRAVEEVAKTQRIVRAEASKQEAILKGEQMKEVSLLEKEAAENYKQKLILEGQGEATKKRLIMQADGALEKRLAAIVQMNKDNANAMANAKPGALVPQIVMGGNNGGNANDFLRLLTAKAAKDLSLDLSVVKGR